MRSIGKAMGKIKEKEIPTSVARRTKEQSSMCCPPDQVGNDMLYPIAESGEPTYCKHIQRGRINTKVSCQGILDNCLRRETLPHQMVQSRYYNIRRLPNQVYSRNTISSVGMKRPERIHAQGLRRKSAEDCDRLANCRPFTRTMPND